MNSELGAFLRDRRDRRQPSEVGLPANARRRVPGLRREELAIVAGISPDHYQRIEQGRANPSKQVIDALARALDLDDTERRHLYDLARRPTGGRRQSSISPQLDLSGAQALVDSFQGPAYILNHRRDLIAWNQLAAALHIDFGSVSLRDRNMIWLIMTHPQIKDRYPDWETAARTQVGLLRRASAAYPDDQKILDLIGRLSTHSPQFNKWWRRREVREGIAGRKKLHHPHLGQLCLDYQVLHPSGTPEFEIFVYYASTATATDQLRRLRERTGEG